MDSTAGNSGGYLALMQRRWVWIAIIVPTAILASVFIAFSLPPKYRSSATIILESATVQKELIQTSVASYEDQQIVVISGRVLTLDTLETLVHDYDPYPDQPGLSVSQKARLVRDDTSLERVDPVTGLPLDKSSAFAVYYLNSDPNRAAAMTTRLADLFLQYHQRVRSETAKAATKLIEEQSASITKDLAALDNDYANLRIKYGQAMPDEGARNQESRDRAERDLESMSRDLRSAQEKESLLEIRLAGLSPNLLTNKGDLTDLATVKAQLAEAEQKYTPDHPDVKRLRRAMQQLMAQGNSGGLASSIHADNPQYLTTSSELSAARKDVAALQASVAKAREQIDTYSGFLRRSPEVEREYTTLQRRRETLQTQYQQIQEKLKNARMGQEFEAGQQGEHFSMIRAPFASRQPYSPNRIGIVLLGMVLGFGVLAAAIAIAEGVDSTLRGSKDLAALGTIPILGGVPIIQTPRDHARRRRMWIWFVAAYVIAISVVAATIYRTEIRLNRIQATVITV